MQLTNHFSLEEFTNSDYAIRNGVNNTASPNIIGNLKLTADGLEQVRKLLGKAINISSGYRCPTLNRAIGGVSSSAHVLGFAADFTCKEFGTPTDIVKAIKASDIKFDQCICEGTWVHISFAPAMRQETLLATFINGKAKYSEFA